MRKQAKYGSLVVLTLIALSAAANASVCTTNTLTSYDAGGFTCQVGAATASEFGTVLVSAFGGTPSSTDAITVVPTGGMNTPGFNFNANYSASGCSPRNRSPLSTNSLCLTDRRLPLPVCRSPIQRLQVWALLWPGNSSASTVNSLPTFAPAVSR